MNQLQAHISSRTPCRRRQGGFTVIELIVVVGIVVTISSIVLASYSQFGGTVLLRNLAYDVALSVREAQIFGISARSFGGVEFAAGHGVYFDLQETNRSFTLFTDANEDGVYTSAGSEWVETYNLGQGYLIERICVPDGETEDCLVTDLSILFKRPEPDAIIRASFGSGFSQYERARIVVMSPREDRMSILVEAAGQISVQRYTLDDE